MRLRHCVFALFFFIIHSAHAQLDTTMALRIGQRCPDILFKNILRYSKPQARLSDFKGKAVILDFWATWCVPCIKSFPKLEKIQQTMGNELQIFLVTNDKPKDVQTFYSMKKDMSLPTAIVSAKDSIFLFFPHREIPFYVWLDKDHIIRATTDYTQMTEEAVREFVKGRKPAVDQMNGLALAQRKSPMQELSESFDRDAKNPDTNMLAMSSLRRANIDDSAKYIRKRYVGPYFANRSIDISQATIARLYCIAYGGYNSRGGVDSIFERDRVIVESKDSSIITSPAYHQGVSSDSGLKWFRKNAYQYSMVLPPGKGDSLRRFNKMKRDLDDFFGYKCRIAKRNVLCIVLHATGPNIIASKKDTTGIFITPYGVDMRRTPLDAFLSRYQLLYDGSQVGYRKYLPYINDTGWPGNVDMKFSVQNMGDLRLVNEQLAKFNLSLSIEKRNVDMLVISDQ